MSVHTGSQGFNILGDLRQWGGVALSQLTNPAGKRLRDPVQFGLHSSSQGSQPFVIHHERLDFVLGQLAILRRDLGLQVLLRIFNLIVGFGFLLNQGQVYGAGIN